MRKLIREFVRLVLQESVCKVCGDDNPYADPNQPDGSFVCATCRARAKIWGGSGETPKDAPKKDVFEFFGAPAEEWARRLESVLVKETVDPDQIIVRSGAVGRWKDRWEVRVHVDDEDQRDAMKDLVEYCMERIGFFPKMIVGTRVWKRDGTDEFAAEIWNDDDVIVVQFRDTGYP